MRMSSGKVPLGNGTLKVRWLLHVHRWLGLAAGVMMASTAGSGLVLLFLAELNLRGHRPQSEPARLVHYAPALAELVARHPGSTLLSVSVPLEEAGTRSWQVHLRDGPARLDRLVADLDPSSGRIVAERRYTDTAFRRVLALHYSFLLGAPGEWLAWGLSVAFVVLSLSGLWMSRQVLRGLWRQGGAGWQPRRWGWGDFHRRAGLASLPLALVWGVTGFCFLLEIAPRSLRKDPRPDPTPYVRLHRLADLPAMHARAAAQFPGRPLMSVRFVDAGDRAPNLRFRFLFRDAAPWHKFGEVAIDGREGGVLEVVRPEDRRVDEKVSTALHALHYGFYGGRGTQLLWAVGAIGIFALPISGYLVAARRRRR